MCAIGSEAWFPVMPSILLTWSRYGSFAELPGRCCVTEAGGAGVEMRLVGCLGLAVSRLVTAAGIIMVATLPKPMVPTISNKAYFIERYFWPDRILSGASSQSAFLLPLLPDPESIARSIQHWAFRPDYGGAGAGMDFSGQREPWRGRKSEGQKKGLAEAKPLNLVVATPGLEPGTPAL